MPKHSSANSSPVTRPLSSARVSSKALSRSALSQASSTGSRAALIPSPAKPARASKGSAHIVSFAEAKRSTERSRATRQIGVHSAPLGNNIELPMIQTAPVRGNHAPKNTAKSQSGIRGAHASVDLTKQHRAQAKKTPKSPFKNMKLSALPFGKKDDKEFVIPSGADLTTDSSNVFGNFASEAEEAAPQAAVFTEEPRERKSLKDRITRISEDKKSRASDKRRKKSKAKANKKFDKAYGGAEKSDTKAGPRAAVYAAKMGPKQKKSSKMQVKDVRSMAEQSVGFIGDKVTSFSMPKLPKIATRSITAVAVCGALCLGLYAPAQQYYVQMRETARLQAEYIEVAERTNNLADSIDSLKTKEGIEDKAHSDLGYVKHGEKSATVKGIADINLLDLPTANVAPGSIPAPDTWYSGALDVLFGYIG